jgi:hypothetical protein
MYIRTKEQALEAVAAILDLPERRRQLVQSTVQIVLCMEPEPRQLMSDCQALLLEGGLDALRQKRREAQEALEPMPLVVLDPEGDRLFEEIGSAMDALRLSKVMIDVHPGLLATGETWRAARALLQREAAFRGCVTDSLRGNDRDGSRRDAELLLRNTSPVWAPRAGELRSAVRRLLEASGAVAPARLDEEAEQVFALFATADERAMGLLASIDDDPEGAQAQVVLVHDQLQAVRSTQEAAAA